MTAPHVDLQIGNRVRFVGDRRWWLVQATDARWVVLTRQADFRPAGELLYTIIDWQEDVRGPCDLLGQGWDFHPTTVTDDAERLLRALQYRVEVHARLDAGEVSVTMEETSTEVSHRNRVPIAIVEVLP